MFFRMVLNLCVAEVVLKGGDRRRKLGEGLDAVDLDTHLCGGVLQGR